MTDTSPKCNHTYTLKSGKIFRCDKEPHRPQDGHYFVRDKDAEMTRDLRLKYMPRPRMVKTF